MFCFKTSFKNAGIDKMEYTPYWFKHTFSISKLKKLPAEKVKIHMGHRTIKTTLKYRHPDLDTLRKEAQTLRKI
jgi:integrase